MKFKAKLIISFLIIILMPITLLSGACGIIFRYQVNSIEQSYDVESDTLQVLKNPMIILNHLAKNVYKEIVNTAKEQPDKLIDQEYINDINSQLKDRYSFLIVRVQDDIIYVGNKETAEYIEDNLPKFGDYSADIDGGVYVGGAESLLIKQQDFYTSDQIPCSMFIITDVDTLVPQIKSSFIQISISIVLIMCLTALLMIFWLYRTIIRPLNTLREATNKMKEGDLNFNLTIKSKDEIGCLCCDFEEMRHRLKELLETKKEYERQSKEVISNISHDIKTPLTAIKGYTEGILDGVADTPEKLEKYLRTIYTKANDMTVLVDELSLFSKFDLNGIQYQFCSINLDQYFSDCISEIMLDLEVKNIDIGYFNYADPSLKVIIDPEQLKRVINNIIGNSVKYMDKKKGIINIRIQEQIDHVIIEIEDNGKGIPSKDIPFVFKRFFRADASRNTAQGGSGLGLAIVKKIITDHEGTIWVKSKENIGTTIFFTLKKEGMKYE